MRLSVILKDPDKKNFFLILKEAIIYMFIKREPPYYYFGKFMYRKSVSNYKDYLSLKETDSIALSKKFNTFEYTSLLRNKIAFSIFCDKNNIPTPELISYNLKTSFFYNSNIFKIGKEQDLINYFETILKERAKTALFLKPASDMGGSGCILLKKETLSEQVENNFEQLVSQIYLHQELLIQHPEINKISPNCINTLRFDTYIDKSNKPHILSVLMRFGIGNSVVDNASSGGFYVKVNLKDGTLHKVGKQLMRYGGKLFYKHPDTNYALEGFKIPYFKEACELIFKSVDYIPDRIIGWDIAITETGPTLVEGNDNNSIFMLDMVLEGALKNPLFKEILKESKN